MRATGASRSSVRPSAACPCTRAHGLHALYHGDEAIVDVASFSLEGRAIRKVRQSVHRLEQAGYVAHALRPSEIDGRLQAELESLAKAWRGDQPERGFVMALDALFSLGDEHAMFVVGFDPDGTAAGFLHFALTTAAPRSLSLSSMPRLRTTPERLQRVAHLLGRQLGARQRVSHASRSTSRRSRRCSRRRPS